MIAGSRPDIAEAYPGYPNNNFGWGLQILTNQLTSVDFRRWGVIQNRCGRHFEAW
jgi:hypothetical protein